MADHKSGESSQEGTSNEAEQGRWSALAFAKAEIVQPLANMQHISPDSMTEACVKAAKLLNKKRVPSQTVYNWVKQFKSGGVGALEHKEHRDFGESTLHPDLKQFIIDEILSPRKYTLAAVHRNACDKARRMDLDETNWPSYDQVRFIDAQLSVAEKIYGRKGSRAYRNTHEPVGHFEASTINEIWQGDHHLLDIQLINPEGKPQRPWITALIDDYSRAIMGFYLTFTKPNSHSVASALHHAMLPKAEERWIMHGIPAMLYVDNGKDLLSRHISEACMHFSIERRSHEPYLARSKGKIERWFRTLEEMLIAYLDGYVGSNPQKSPARVTPKLTIEELRAKIVDFILNTYHERIHSQTRETPYVRWQRATTSLRSVEHSDDLDYLLEHDHRTVQNDGIRFINRFYSDTEGKLKGYIGRRVEIFFNRNDVSSIRVRYRDESGERFLCVAYPDIDARVRAEQNKEVRRELSKKIRASRKRSRNEERQREQQGNTASSQPDQQSQPSAKRSSTSHTSRPTIRYRFEMEQSDDDDTY